jgi:hypothetical protein
LTRIVVLDLPPPPPPPLPPPPASSTACADTLRPANAGALPQRARAGSLAAPSAPLRPARRARDAPPLAAPSSFFPKQMRTCARPPT